MVVDDTLLELQYSLRTPVRDDLKNVIYRALSTI